MDSNSRPSTEQLGPFQLVLLVLSLLVLATLAADTFFHLPAEIARILHVVDTLVCGVFLIDFVIRFRAAPVKAEFMKWGWIDLLASIPVIESLRWGRAVRVLRVLRLLRGLRSFQRIFALLFARRAHGGVASLGLVSFLVVSFSSVGILLCERDPNANIRSAEDAIWWSMTTITTVGYGDKYPVTTAGRVLAVAVMITGVGLFGTLSGLVASLFVGENENQIEREESKILTEIRTLRTEIAELRAARSRALPPG